MTTSEFTMRFFKNGQEVAEANAGEIIDVELEGTFDVTQIREKEIYNFDLNMDDIDFQNATYVDGSLTNALGTTTPDSGTGTFLATSDGVGGGRRSLTYKIKFQIKLAKANKFFTKTTIVKAKGSAFNFSDGKSNIEKKFYLKIKPKYPHVVPALSAIGGSVILYDILHGDNEPAE